MREETPFFSIKRGFLSQTLTFPKRTTKGSFTPLETLIFLGFFLKIPSMLFSVFLDRDNKHFLSNCRLSQKSKQREFHPFGKSNFFWEFFWKFHLCFFQSSLAEIIKILSQTLTFLKRTTKGCFPLWKIWLFNWLVWEKRNCPLNASFSNVFYFIPRRSRIPALSLAPITLFTDWPSL